MKFTIDSKLPPVANPMLDRCLKLLRSLPDGELITGNGLIAKLGCGRSSLSHTTSMIPEQLSCVTGNKKLYGNPKTIAAWKKRPKPI